LKSGRGFQRKGGRKSGRVTEMARKDCKRGIGLKLESSILLMMITIIIIDGMRRDRRSRDWGIGKLRKRKSTKRNDG
jgi:hypothetical protein